MGLTKIYDAGLQSGVIYPRMVFAQSHLVVRGMW